MLQYFIYAILIVILAIIIYGAISRKKVYSDVDRLEAWKIQIMNKPVTDEIAKIKGLNMSGETEEKFETWRNKWDEILTLKLPDLEERLFDVEEAANKYRFVKAKNMLRNITDELSNIEEGLQEMLADVNHLINSEEDNRQQIDDIRKVYKELKKYFNQNKNLLGSTAYAFENRLGEIEKSFTDFESATKEGNYFEAREILLMMKEQITLEKSKIDEVPKILVQIETEVPSQLEELSQGIIEMENEGYIIEHFTFKSDIREMQSQLYKLLPVLEKGNTEDAGQVIQEMYKEIDHIYDVLEQEVLAKQFVNYEIVTLREAAEALRVEFYELKADVETIKQSYRIPEEELKTHLKLEKQIKELLNKLCVIEDTAANNKQSNITIKRSIEELNLELEERQATLEECNEALTSLRSDELKAQEMLKELKGKIRQGQRLIKKSNIPGLPEVILEKLDEAQTSLLTATEKLEKIPLVMSDVSDSMEEVLETVNEVYDLISKTIEQALSAERVIQYGNRFRSHNTYIHVELLRAEEAFRFYQYEEALEIALRAIKEIDPQVLARINSYTLEKV
ncbi:septation ring formation regulator EzrA [Anaerobacillus sp. CMMVII]|uniref:septation ring formation regulator EzrA n=1 Tax=Anaerobacillus sp. CMMVII TaxID=2755588 RepID=UPI0021B71F05|nr:septation ring formation regulator EzrA [Anaerobacillus sp. CMMVII]MCT8137361.1 septation ring formation regulator EzrA [Anaerobacillus sp. CMMVII]